MANPAIRVEGLGKRYRIGRREATYRTLRDTIMNALQASLCRIGNVLRPDPDPVANREPDETIWALKDVSFDINRGEVVGIIGRNGAGKSTLLKILSEITEPTEGRVEIHGRVGSLLEVGTGFHPELTGRENVYLNGAILGMRRAEIERKFDEIVAFAEVEKFIDTPVKHYSSGMYLRLAFAVAAHLEPEILIVDEVLAVGDATFQKKCLGKMAGVAQEGRTVLFVSHNMAAIQHLCERVMVLNQGRVAYSGSPQEGIKRYAEAGALPSAVSEMDLTSHPNRRRGCLPLLKGIRLLDSNQTAKARFLSGAPMVIELKFDPVIPLEDPQFGIGIDDVLGTRVFSVATYLSKSRLSRLVEPCTVACYVDELPLAPGRYSLSLSAGMHHNFLVDALDHAISFDVDAADFYGNGRLLAALGRVLVRSRWVAQC